MILDVIFLIVAVISTTIGTISRDDILIDRGISLTTLSILFFVARELREARKEMEAEKKGEDADAS